MEFREFKELQQIHFEAMTDGQNTLFTTGIDKDVLWQTYLESFPDGANQIYRERREFDCSFCKSFVRTFGDVVVIKDNELVSIWDFNPDANKFGVVTNALSMLVKSAPIKDVFVTKHGAFGTDKSREQLENGSIHTWEHFRIDLPRRFVTSSHKSEGWLTSQHRDTKNVFKRSLDEIWHDAIATVLDLIEEKTLYRGDEWQAILSQFFEIHNEYHTLPDEQKDNYCWSKSVEVGGVIGRIRNHSIGVLLQDLSDGVELDVAMRRYERIVAPTNYKRPKAIFTRKMVEQAQETVANLGLIDSLGRRHAVLGDITINNVVWANRNAEKHMNGVNGAFEMLMQDVTVKPKSFDNVQGVSIDAFLSDILPNATNLEVLLENRHESNLMSLIAPKAKDSPTMFKWANGFSWAYNGNIADSMKQRVKDAGGNVEGVLRFSLQWNDGEYNPNDFDAHCIEPNRNEVYFSNKGMVHPSSGVLDVDIIHPTRGKAAVENITWSDINRMQEGEYDFFVHNYSHNGGRSGFDAQIEYDGQIYEYSYDKELAQGERVRVAKLRFDKQSGVKFLESLPSTNSTKTVWNLQTNRFHPVSTFMFSPNYWDGQNGIGHKHFLFMVAGCKNESRPNGFFNEYLREDFMEHKRVFEALGSKMKVDESDNQLSGLGFSSTKRNSLICKVDDRVVKVIF